MLEWIAFLLPIDPLIHLITFSLVLLLFDKTSLAIVRNIDADELRPWSNSLKVKSENGWRLHLKHGIKSMLMVGEALFVLATIGGI